MVEGGRDTFIINFSFLDTESLMIDGGEGNDRILVEGGDNSDIIRVVTWPDGSLKQITLEANNPNAGTAENEEQVISLPANTQAGTFTLTFQGETTGDIAYDADDAAVQAALESLASVNAGDLSVSGASMGPWTVSFDGNLAATDVGPITTNGNLLEVTGGTMIVSTIT